MLQGSLLDMRKVGPGVAQAQTGTAGVIVVVDAWPEGQLPLLRQQLLLPQLLLHIAKPISLQAAQASTSDVMPGGLMHADIMCIMIIPNCQAERDAAAASEVCGVHLSSAPLCQTSQQGAPAPARGGCAHRHAAQSASWPSEGAPQR